MPNEAANSEAAGVAWPQRKMAARAVVPRAVASRAAAERVAVVRAVVLRVLRMHMHMYCHVASSIAD